MLAENLHQHTNSKHHTALVQTLCQDYSRTYAIKTKQKSLVSKKIKELRSEISAKISPKWIQRDEQI